MEVFSNEDIQNAEIALTPMFNQALWLIRRRVSAEELHGYNVLTNDVTAILPNGRLGYDLAICPMDPNKVSAEVYYEMQPAANGTKETSIIRSGTRLSMVDENVTDYAYRLFTQKPVALSINNCFTPPEQVAFKKMMKCLEFQHFRDSTLEMNINDELLPQFDEILQNQ